jgi:hypothetical protein
VITYGWMSDAHVVEALCPCIHRAHPHVLCDGDLSICNRHRSEAWKCLYGQYAVPVLVANGQTVPTYVLLHAFLNDRFQLTADFDLPFGEGVARVTVWRGS